MSLASNLPITGHLIRLVHELRNEGIRISIAELMDAFNALQQVDWSDRDQVRVALRTTLVKEQPGLVVLDQVFDRYFASPERQQQWEEEALLQRQEQESRMQQAEDELTFGDQSLALTDADKELYLALDPEAQQRVQEFLQKTSQGKNVTPDRFQPLVKSLVQGHLNYWRRRHVSQEQPTAGLSGLDGVDLLHRDMGRIDDIDLPRVERAMARLARRLATRLSRRYRSSSKVSRVDLRRSIRRNQRFGGAILDLKYKVKRVQKPRLLILCDVSGSMARYATFVLQFVYGLAGVMPGIQSYVFAEELEQVTPFFVRRRDFQDTMNKVMTQSRIWGAGTKLSNALQTLQETHTSSLGSRTVMVILSDAQTLDPNASVTQLARVRRRVRDVIWLNPLRREEWERYSVIGQFQRFCQMYPCNTLAQLEQVLQSNLLH